MKIRPIDIDLASYLWTGGGGTGFRGLGVICKKAAGSPGWKKQQMPRIMVTSEDAAGLKMGSR